ncbi:MAG: MFS transporter [Candidatus Lokiarchaeota archaeon]|nr:MFS transporter [Candidatus Lokiarchaeota archaeon]
MSRITRASYAVLIACTAAHLLNHMYTGALSPFLPLIRDELTLNYTEVGIVTSAAIITMTISHLMVGYLGDKGWRDFFISSSVILSAIVILFTSFATSFVFITICMLLLGTGASGYHPSAFPALSEKFPCGARAKATGMQAIGGLVGMAIIPILGATLLILLGNWRDSLFLLGIIGVISFFPIAGLMRYSNQTCVGEFRDGETEEDNRPEGWTRDYALSILSMGLRGMPFRCTTLLMPLYLVESYGYEPVWAGSLTTVMLVAGLVGEVISAPLSDRVGRRVPFLIISAGLTTICLGFLYFPLEPIVLLAILIGIGFFFFLGVPPNTAYLTEVTPRDAQGLAFGLLFSVGALPGAIAPIIFGAIGDFYGIETSILFLVLTAGLATIVSVFLRDTNTVKQDEEIISKETTISKM